MEASGRLPGLRPATDHKSSVECWAALGSRVLSVEPRWGVEYRVLSLSVNTLCRGQVSMSSTEAELVALADCAIELIAVMGVLESLGFEIDGPVAVATDNKGARPVPPLYVGATFEAHRSEVVQDA